VKETVIRARHRGGRRRRRARTIARLLSLSQAEIDLKDGAGRRLPTCATFFSRCARASPGTARASRRLAGLAYARRLWRDFLRRRPRRPSAEAETSGPPGACVAHDRRTILAGAPSRSWPRRRGLCDGLRAERPARRRTRCSSSRLRSRRGREEDFHYTPTIAAPTSTGLSSQPSLKPEWSPDSAASRPTYIGRAWWRLPPPLRAACR